MDPEVLAAGVDEVTAYLTDLHGVGRRFATRRPTSRSRTWLDAYAESARFWFLSMEDAALIAALCHSDAEGTRNPRAYAKIEQWLRDMSADDAEHRRRSTRLARLLAEAFDPPGASSAPLDSARVRALYVQRLRINRLHARVVECFQTLPPVSWLPVLGDEDDCITMTDAGWPRRAAVAFLTAFLGADERTIRRHITKGKRRRD